MDYANSKVRSVFVAMIVHLLMIIPDLAAAVMANSLSMYSDVLKSGIELLATFLSWLTLRRIEKGKHGMYEYGIGKFENMTSLAVAGVILVSVVIISYTAVSRLSEQVRLHEGGAYFAMVMMLIGVGVNFWLFKKNYRLSKKEYSPIMEAQWRLFFTKILADGSVLISLALSIALSGYSWSIYIDPLSSFILCGFLLHAMHSILTHSIGDLLDKTLDESMQMVIVRELGKAFDEYRLLHGVRSRRSGSRIFIDIFLEFEPEKSMREVQDSIDRIKFSVEQQIKGAQVLVAPCRICPAGQT